jgi:hypothetical protein
MSLLVPLKWIEPIHGSAVPVTWGVPWEQGELSDPGSLVLYSGSGSRPPLSSWVSARWPDGSVKWTTHAAVLNGRETYSLARDGTPAGEEKQKPLAWDSRTCISVSTPLLSCEIPKTGEFFIRDLKLQEKSRG